MGHCIHLFVFIFLALSATANNISLYPANNAKDINPEVLLKITFNKTPVTTDKGFIKIFDSTDGKLVDMINLSIPAGPKVPDMIRKKQATYSDVPYEYETTNYTNANTKAGTPSGTAKRDTSLYQLNIIGRFTDGFRFHPVIVKENTATIYFHNNMLEYGKEYYVTVDKDCFAGIDFKGINGKTTWKFSTKTQAPKASVKRLTVASDGSGDFNTVQGCMDFIPDFSKDKWEVNIKNGDYEELVYFRNKCNVTLKGESRDGVVIHYANNETFNPHPINVKTNEVPGTFPSRRAAFTADNCYDLRFENLTIMTTLKGQAEGLLIMGGRNYLKNVHIIGSGDALQANGSVYLENCIIDGDGDTVLGRGPAFFKNCTISSAGAFMWIRNTAANHGNVFVDCTMIGRDEHSIFARSPINHGKSYPYAEAVLINCTLDNVPAEGWGEIEGDPTNVHFWEYNSRDKKGDAVDVSKRYPLSRQLDAEKDAEIIRNYSNPAYVLDWYVK
ncbi:MAG: carbohydrate esterase [Culturomica sp.]|jgi:pectin methylesterase-like acyl-CoA thioesterase|nr:carbohydrate esterase [Culturomica sp.]